MTSTKRRRRYAGPRMPALRAHTVRGVAYGYATFDGEERRYGRLDDEARKLFAEDLAVWTANGGSFPEDAGEDGVDAGGAALTVSDLKAGYLHHVEVERTARWRANNEPRHRLALEAAAKLFGDLPAADFGPLRLKAVREHLVGLKREDGKTPKLTVWTINERVRLIRSAFAWAVSEELVPAAVLEGLRAVPALREGRPGTRGSRLVLPVEREHVDAVLPFLSRPVAALVELMWWTGARPSELFRLTPGDIDRSCKVWSVRLDQHKTSGKGKRRGLFFGPQAQAVLKPLLLRPTTRPLFRPAEALDELRRRRREARETPLWPSHEARYERERAARAAQPPSETYDAASFGRAVQRAIVLANREREAKGLDPVPMWHPYRLRHSAATRIRAEHGIEAARVLLGHSSATMTEVYAEVDLQTAAGVAESTG